MSCNLLSIFNQYQSLKKDEKLAMLYIKALAEHKGNSLFKAELKHLSSATGLGRTSLKKILYSLSEKNLIAYNFQEETIFYLENLPDLYDIKVELIKNEFLETLVSYQKKKETLLVKIEFIEDLINKTKSSYQSDLKQIEVQKEVKRKLREEKLNTSNPSVNTPSSLKTNLTTVTTDINDFTLEQEQIEEKKTASLDLIENDSEQIINDFFQEFWSLYPRKEGKAIALKAMNKKDLKSKIINSDNFKNKVLQGLKNYKNYNLINNIEKQFTLHPSTWLNNQGWEDEGRQIMITDEQLEQLKQGFQSFWEAYPNKDNEKATKLSFFKLYQSILNQPEFLDTLIKSSKHYSDYVKNQDSKFIKSANKWLDDKSWEQDYQSLALNGQSVIINNPRPKGQTSYMDISENMRIQLDEMTAKIEAAEALEKANSKVQLVN